MTIKINGTNTTAQPSITGTDTDTGLVYGTDEVSIVTGGTERVTVNNTGLGIGTTSPQRALVISDAGTEGFEFFPGSSSGGNTLNHYNRATSAFVNITTNADQHIFGRADGEKLRIQSGGGISFNGDTATANALDDYEEGTFTPIYTSGITSPSYSSTLGHYKKIGGQVTFTLRIQASGTNTNSIVKIGGLPFNSVASGGLAGREGAAFFNYPGNLPDNQDRDFPTLHISTGNTEIEFIYFNKGDWTGTFANGISTRDLHISGFYWTS